MTGGLFAFLGALTGALQAGLLGRAAARGPHPLWLLARLTLVGGVLLCAARAGHLLPAAAGWLVGFLVATVWVHRRLG